MKPDRHGNDERTGRGTNGRRCCRFCGGDVQAPRRTFCSDKCVEEWCIRSSASGARNAVKKRDRGICAGCGLDVGRLEKRAAREAFGRWFQNDDQKRLRRDRIESVKVAAIRRIRDTHPKVALAVGARFARSGWQADHIRPVVRGGGSCGLDNLRTLCLDCHAKETARLVRELAEQKRIARESERGIGRLFG